MSAIEETGDVIHIEELELAVRIGVPDEERETPQRLTVSITLWPRSDFADLDDQLENTVNYAAVCSDVKEFANGRSVQLIETLASALAARLLQSFPIRKVRLEVRKFILPDVKHVAAVATREQTSGK